jgi:hypothetical protein
MESRVITWDSKGHLRGSHGNYDRRIGHKLVDSVYIQRHLCVECRVFQGLRYGQILGRKIAPH